MAILTSLGPNLRRRMSKARGRPRRRRVTDITFTSRRDMGWPSHGKSITGIRMTLLAGGQTTVIHCRRCPRRTYRMAASTSRAGHRRIGMRVNSCRRLTSLRRSLVRRVMTPTCRTVRG